MKINKVLVLSALLSLLFAVIYSVQAIKLYDAHRTRGDLTSYAQAIWNTSEGRVMQGTFNYSLHNFWGDRNMLLPSTSNILGIHFNPIVISFALFYKFYPHPQTLLVLQAFLTAFASLLLFIISRKEIKNTIICFLIQLSFLLYSPVVSTVLSEFHAISLAIFFGALLILFSKKSLNWYLVSLGLFLLIQENTAIVATVFGLYLLLFKDTRKKGVITVVISLSYFLSVLKIFIPKLSNYKGYIFESIYGSKLGTSLGQIAFSAFKHPILFITNIVTGDNINYIGKVVLPLIPFVFLSPFLLLVAMSGLTANILSSSQSLKSFNLHYEAVSISFLFYAGILGIRNFLWITRKYQKFAVLIVIVILLCMTTLGYKKITSLKLNRFVLTTNIYSKSDTELDSIIKRIPSTASVSTQDYISGSLTNRKELYLFPVYYNQVDYLLLSTGDSIWPLEKKVHYTYINKLINNKKYKVEYKSSNYMLIKRL